jgi:hypothetical protein
MLFPAKYGPRNHAVGAAEAYLGGRAKLRAIRNAALVAMGSPPDHPQIPGPPPYPYATARTTPVGGPPGYNVREIPASTISQLPLAAQRHRRVLEQRPWELAPGGIDPRAGAAGPEQKIRMLSYALTYDPMMGRRR